MTFQGKWQRAVKASSSGKHACEVLAWVELGSKAKVYQPQRVPRVAVVCPQHDVIRGQVKVAKMASTVQLPQRLHTNNALQQNGPHGGRPACRLQGQTARSCKTLSGYVSERQATGDMT